jgi:hypothetical protein
METCFSFQRRVNKARQEGRGKEVRRKIIEKKAGRKEE